jgi:hypothetical protein
MKAISVAALGRARMALTALFRSFAHANDSNVQRQWDRKHASAYRPESTGGGDKEIRPKIATTVAIENVQSDDQPLAVV